MAPRVIPALGQAARRNGFLSQQLAHQLTPETDLEALAEWARRYGMNAEVGTHSNREFYLDAPAAFVDFVIEAVAGTRRLRQADQGHPSRADAAYGNTQANYASD
jgi:hypothetical protein